MARWSATLAEGDHFARDCTSNKGATQVERAKARATRRAKARARSCSPLKAILGVSGSGKKIDSGWETATSILFLGTRGDHPITYNTWARSGSSSTTTREQLRQPFLWNLRRAFVVQGGRVHRGDWSTHPQLFGRAKLETVDELGNKRKIDGHATEVHKPLASASGKNMKYHDAFVFEEFGDQVGEVYNNCLKRASKLEMAPVEPNQVTVLNEQQLLLYLRRETPSRPRRRKAGKSVRITGSQQKPGQQRVLLATRTTTGLRSRDCGTCAHCEAPKRVCRREPLSVERVVRSVSCGATPTSTKEASC